MMSDPKYVEKWRYKDTINDYNNIVEGFQKLYEQTPASDLFMRARIQNGMRKSKRDLAKTQAEYEIFKNYRARTAISR